MFLAALLSALSRAVSQPSEFSFESSGVSNHFVTPNGDGRNDRVVFTFSNPRFSEVTGRIYDWKGAFVSDMAVHPLLNVNTQRVWDGRRNGNLVPSGMYIYQLESEDKSFSGTVFVIR